MFGQFFLTSTVLAFNMEPLGRFSKLETFFDAVMFIDIILTFCTAIPYSEKMSEERISKAKAIDDLFDTNMKRIAFKYITGLFIPDILGCLPALVTFNQTRSMYLLKLFKFMHMQELANRLINVVNTI